MSYSDLIRGQMHDTTLEPPAEPEPLETCCFCGRGLYEGDFAFNIMGDIVCQKCMEEKFGFFVND